MTNLKPYYEYWYSCKKCMTLCVCNGEISHILIDFLVFFKLLYTMKFHAISDFVLMFMPHFPARKREMIVAIVYIPYRNVTFLGTFPPNNCHLSRDISSKKMSPFSGHFLQVNVTFLRTFPPSNVAHSWTFCPPGKLTFPGICKPKKVLGNSISSDISVAFIHI